MAGDDFHIAPVRSAANLSATIALFRAYAASLPVDLAYQGFEAELAAMPGAYTPPRGGDLLLARDPGDTPLGCVALRRLDRRICEMKRLYVAPEARGLGVGRALAEAIIWTARKRGYRVLRLDTLPSMDQAIALYRAMGFVPIAPYYDTAVPGTIFLALALRR